MSAFLDSRIYIGSMSTLTISIPCSLIRMRTCDNITLDHNPGRTFEVEMYYLLEVFAQIRSLQRCTLLAAGPAMRMQRRLDLEGGSIVSRLCKKMPSRGVWKSSGADSISVSPGSDSRGTIWSDMADGRWRQLKPFGCLKDLIVPICYDLERAGAATATHRSVPH
jgi:hypothetical protein